MNASLTHLQGRKLEAVTYDADTHEWIFALSGGVALQISAPWRVLSRGRIAVGWRDDGQWFGLDSPADVPQRIRALAGSGMVRTATLDGSSGDLEVQFENGSIIQVFNDSCGYEGWILNGPGKRYVVAQGGGRVVDSECDG